MINLFKIRGTNGVSRSSAARRGSSYANEIDGERIIFTSNEKDL